MCILGDGDFVNQVLRAAAETFTRREELVCYWGHSRPGLTGKELARYFKMSQPSVSQAVRRGEKFARENKLKLLS